jgi:hypothetical protein
MICSEILESYSQGRSHEFSFEEVNVKNTSIGKQFEWL